MTPVSPETTRAVDLFHRHQQREALEAEGLIGKRLCSDCHHQDTPLGAEPCYLCSWPESRHWQPRSTLSDRLADLFWTRGPGALYVWMKGRK
jgi:hypothetical protein